MNPEQAVANGVKFLDETLPNWRTVVDWDSLSMQDSSKCMLGQTHGYRATLEQHGHGGGKWAEEHGFFVFPKGESTGKKYKELELLWQKQSGEGNHETYK